jgi:DNA-binding PadR family transcriptional regulator
VALRDVVLSQIIERPGWAYELNDRLSDWSRAMDLSGAAIHAALASLEKDRLICVVDRAVGPDRRASTKRTVFAATPAGEEHHRDWMTTTAGKTPLREAIHMQMLVAEDRDIPVLLASLDLIEADCERQLAHVLAAFSFDAPGRARISEFGAPLVRAGLAMHLQGTMEWVVDSRRALKRRLGEAETGLPGRNRP